MRGRHERGVLVDALGAHVGVDPDRRGVDEARQAELARGLQQRERPARVELLGARRILGHLVDVGRRGEVDHGVAAAHRPSRIPGVSDVADDALDLVPAVVRRAPHVEDARLVARGDQGIDHVRADEARSTGDQDAAHDDSSGR